MQVSYLFAVGFENNRMEPFQKPNNWGIVFLIAIKYYINCKSSYKFFKNLTLIQSNRDIPFPLTYKNLNL